MNKDDYASHRRFLHRRRLLATGLVVLPTALFSSRQASAAVPRRSLRLYHTHTGEKLKVTYYESGRYLRDALREIDHFLRDFRTGEVHAINPRLLDQLDVISQRAGRRGEYQIISGYRSPKTNAQLRGGSNASGVAKKSLHMTGNAIDVRLTGVSTKVVRDVARTLRAGGVGYYAKSDFIHLDTGRPRSW